MKFKIYDINTKKTTREFYLYELDSYEGEGGNWVILRDAFGKDDDCVVAKNGKMPQPYEVLVA